MNVTKVVKEINAFKKDKTSVLLLIDIIFLILPGIALIYLFNVNLFESLDWIKLILLSLSISTPLAFLNALFAETLERQGTEEEFFLYFTLSVIFTGLLLYGIVIVCYLTGRTLREGFIFLATIEVILLICSWFTDRKNQKKFKRS